MTRAPEGEKKGMMDIDNPVRIVVNELIDENLHVPCQSNEVNLVLSKQSQLFVLLRSLVGSGNWGSIVVDAEAFCYRSKVWMVPLLSYTNSVTDATSPLLS